jgi:hypothetical protein
MRHGFHRVWSLCAPRRDRFSGMACANGCFETLSAGLLYCPSAAVHGYAFAVQCSGNSSVGDATLSHFSLRPTHSS